MIQDPMPISTGYVLNASIPATSREPMKSVYMKTVSGVRYTATISHQTTQKGRRRTQVGLSAAKITADPYVPSNSVEDTTTCYLVIDRSERLATDANVITHVCELVGGILAIAPQASLVSTRLAQIVGGES